MSARRYRHDLFAPPLTDLEKARQDELELAAKIEAELNGTRSRWRYEEEEDGGDWRKG